MTFPVFQPDGFRTVYSAPDYDDAHDTPYYRSFTELSASTRATSGRRVGGMSTTVLDQAEVVQVNDNNHALFDMVRLRDRSVVVVDPDLYRKALPTFMTDGEALAPAAIGEVRRTDVLLLELDAVALSGGVVATSEHECSAGLASLISFAELLRRAAKAYLDIDESELEVGLQAWRPGDTLSHRLFVADALDNGAGYAVELGRPEVLQSLLDAIRVDYRLRLEGDDHRASCTSSCPQCLRNYQNRFSHWALDWRLALDVADLANGDPLGIDRWLERADELTSGFVQAFGGYTPLSVTSAAGLPALVSTERGGCAVLLGHPLWRRTALGVNDAQTVAIAELTRSGVRHVSLSDLHALDRRPVAVYAQLLGSS